MDLNINELCQYASDTGNYELLCYAHRSGAIITQVICDSALLYGRETGNYECYQYTVINKFDEKNIDVLMEDLKI